MDNAYKNFMKYGKQRVLTGDFLEDSEIDYFLLLLSNYSTYRPLSTLILQHCSVSDEIPAKNSKHIQIVYLSSASDSPNAVGHWVTYYYDTDYIYVFDSLNKKVLHKDLEKALKALHPYYFEEGKKIIFSHVQQQTNDKDCGVFAIAFAATLLCGVKPNFVRYDGHMMRSHLLKLFANKYIEHFPCSFLPIPVNMQPRKLYNTDIIVNNDCLNDEHIDYFHKILQQISVYQPCSTLFLQNTSRISQIDKYSKHIQILFHESSPVGHFICTYYDTNNLFVYDSMNNTTELHSDYIKVLERLHPYCFNGT